MRDLSEAIARHRSVRFAFRNSESGELYDCICGRRFSDFAGHLGDALVRDGFGDVSALALKIARLERQLEDLNGTGM